MENTIQTASLCPTCYTHTIIKPPAKTCPPIPIRPIPGPACGIVCERQAAARDVDIVPPVTIPRATTVTVGTVTATVPGLNPACPTTSTVTLTRRPVGATPDLACPLASRLPDCACDTAWQTTSTVVEVYTVSETATVYATGTPLTCAFSPTTTTTAAPSQQPPASASTACATYATQWGSVLCLNGDGANTAAVPQITEAPILDTVVKGVPITLLYTRDCTVYIRDHSVQCPSRGV